MSRAEIWYRLIVLVIGGMLLQGCVQPEPKDYTVFNAHKPRSILIVPVVNQSAEVTAPDYFLSTISRYVGEAGYYVFPVHTVKRVLEDNGLADAALVHSAHPQRVGQLFGADAVLYITINHWEARYVVLDTQVVVSMNYILKDADSGQDLWAHEQTIVYSPNSSSSGGDPIAYLVSAMVNAAITKAAPNYEPLAHQANATAFRYPGPGIPPGHYIEVKETQ